MPQNKRGGCRPAGFVYLIVIALVSVIGSLIGSIVLSVAGVGLLNYFFTEPLFSFSVEYPQDILTLTAFLTTSIIVTNLAAKVRKEAVEAKASQKALADTERQRRLSLVPGPRRTATR